MEKTEIPKEKVKFLTELLKIVSLFVLTTAGGVISLLHRLDDPINVFLAIVGTWLEAIWLIMMVVVYSKIQKLFREMEK